jgi:O-antigen/teichoic acid export membrane protein
LEREVSESKSHENFKEQFPKNLFANIAYFLVTVIIGIFLVPYYIGTLGVAAYGLIPLAMSLTGLITILTDSLNIVISRFLTVDLQKKDYKKANKTFNTALFGLSSIIFLIIPVMVVLSYYSPKIFNVPTGQEFEMILLLLGVFTAFLFRSLSSTFTVSLFAYNRLDLLNLLNIITIIVQVFLIITLFTVFPPQLSFIGFAYLFSSIMFLFGAIFLSNHINPHFHVDIREFDRSRIKDLTFMGGWVVIDQIGAFLLFQFDLIVVNLLFGATITGEYALVFVWATTLRAIGWTFAGVFSPMILTYYAKDKLKLMVQISKSSVKGLGLLIALPIGLICGFAPQILNLWVGPQFVHLAPLMWVLTMPLVVSLCVLPLFAITIAFNNVRVPAIITLLMAIGYVILAFNLPFLLGWGYYGVAIAGAIVVTLRSALFVPWYTSKVMAISSKTFIKSMLAGIFATLILAGLTAIIGKIFIISSLIYLIICCGMISIGYLIIIWYIGFNKFEREIVISYFPKKMRSKISM